jgi:hypothetical protein
MGIARRLFELPETTPVDVEVPLDVMAPFRVRHENVTVTAGSDRLVLEPSNNTYPNLEQAMKVGLMALGGLPETPVLAAGFNVRFKSSDTLPGLVEIIGHTWDNRFSDEGIEIEKRAIARTVPWRGGKINISVSQEPDLSSTVLLNYDLKSSETNELQRWLKTTISDVREETERILFRCLGLMPGDFCDVDQN